MKVFHAKYIWIFIGLVIAVWAIGDETWLMPGPVSRAHAPIEHRCSACHPGFSGTPNKSCLACKTEMKLVQDRGIHKYAPIRRCATCHVEHRTRPYPLASAWVVEADFNHQWTGFDLGKYHQNLACGRCHAPGLPKGSVKAACDGCHQDFHPGPWDHSRTGCNLDPLHLGLRCRDCHQNGWGPDQKPGCRKCHPAGLSPASLCTP